VLALHRTPYPHKDTVATSFASGCMEPIAIQALWTKWKTLDPPRLSFDPYSTRLHIHLNDPSIRWLPMNMTVTLKLGVSKSNPHNPQAFLCRSCAQQQRCYSSSVPHQRFKLKPIAFWPLQISGHQVRVRLSLLRVPDG